MCLISPFLYNSNDVGIPVLIRIYPADISFLDLNIKVIGSDIHTSVYDKRDDFGFPIVNFPWLSGDVPRLPSYGIYISQLVRFARCCTSVLDFNSKISKLLQNCWHRVIDITSFEKHLESSLDHTLNFCRKGKSHIALNPSRRCLTCGAKWTFCRTEPKDLWMF